MGLRPDLNRDNLSEAALAILALTAFEDHGVVRAWKGMYWDLLEGAKLAEVVLERHFSG